MNVKIPTRSPLENLEAELEAKRKHTEKWPPRAGTVVWVDGHECVAIPIGRQGKQALVDIEDYPLVQPYYWSELRDKWNSYAFRYERPDGGKRVYHRMHRMIINPPIGMEVDHINHNGLDNRRCNLRVVTTRQNQWGQRPQAGKYKGVTREKGRKLHPWRASVMKDGTHHKLGSFTTAEEAAFAYDRVAKVLFGDYAYLNFPNAHDPLNRP